jgi:hypothetical protein
MATQVTASPTEAVEPAVAERLPAIDATGLRALGEFADGYRNTALFLVESGGKYSLVQEAQITPGVKKIAPVYTASTDDRPVPKVSMTVEGVPVPAEKLAHGDALFWSESAIEKFLFPYYAAVRTSRDRLDDLKRLYYHDDGVTPPILAFVHFPDSRVGAIQDPREEREDRPAATRSTPLPARAQQIAPEVSPALDATMLRAFGEHADGYRNVDLFLIKSPDGYKLVEKADIPPSSKPLLRAFTKSRVTRAVPEIHMTVNGVPVPKAELALGDALFWSDSAVEEFVFPYYTAMRTISEDKLDRLRKLWAGDGTDPVHGRVRPHIAAVFHKPWSGALLIPNPRGEHELGLVLGGVAQIGGRKADHGIAVPTLHELLDHLDRGQLTFE